MPGFLDRFRGASADDVLLLSCEPLVVVHAEDGTVFAANVQVEYRPDDASGQTGNVKVEGFTTEGWTPQLKYRQRIETIQGLDPRLQKRPGLILIGEDEAGEPFTWYINGEADRFVTRPPAESKAPNLDADQAAAILATPIARDQSRVFSARLLHIVRSDGWCPLSTATQIRSAPSMRSPVAEHLTSLTVGDDGDWPELFVLSKDEDGETVRGIDANGILTTWYLDAAAEEYLSRLP